MSVDVGTAKGYLDLDITGFLNSLKLAQAEAATTSASIAATVGKNLTGIGTSLTKVGGSLTKFVTLPIVGAGAAAIKTTATFEQSMSKVSALSGATGDDLDLLSQKAQQMGATTKFTASEAADAFGYMALAGWDTQEMLSGIDGVLSLAAAGELDLASASDMVTDYLTAFGEEADQATRMSDIMARTSTTTNTSVSQLGEAFRNCAVNANATGLDIEQTSALLGVMANNGKKGSEAGTALAAVFRDITNSMVDGNIMIGETSVSVMDAEGNYRQFTDILRDVEGALDGMGDAEQAAALSTTFTARSIQGMRMFVNEGADSIEELTNELYGSSGAAKAVADELLNNLNGQLTILKSALEGVAIKIGTALLPVVKQIVEKVQAFVDKLNKMSDAQIQSMIKTAAMVAAIGPLLLVLGKLFTAAGAVAKGIGGISKAITAAPAMLKAFQTGLAGAATEGFKAKGVMQALGAAIGGITLPMVAVAAAIAAVVGAIIYLWKTSETFRDSVTSMFDNLKSIVENFVNTVITPMIESVKGMIEDIWNNGLKPLWDKFTGMIESITVSLSGFIEAITPFCNWIIDKFGPVLTGVFQVFCDVVGDNFNTLCEVIGIAFDTIGKTIGGLIDIITGIINTITSLFSGDWEGAWDSATGVVDSAVGILEGLLDGLLGIFDALFGDIISAIGEFFAGIGTWFAELPGKFVEVFNLVIEKVKTWASELWTNAQQAGSNFLNGIGTFFSQLPYKIGYFLGACIGSIIKFVIEAPQKAVEMGTNFLNAITTFFSELPGKIQEFLTNAIANVTQWVSDMGAKALEAGTTFINNVANEVSSLPGKMWTYLTTTISDLGKWVSDMGRKGLEAIQSLINNVISGAAEIPGKMAKIGEDIVNGVWDGIKGAAGWFTEQVTGFFGGIVDGVCDFLGIGSPSRVFRDRVGQWLPAGVAVGFKEAMPAALNEIQTTLDKGVDSIETEDISIGAKSGVEDFSSKVKSIYNDVATYFESVDTRLAKSIDSMAENLGILISTGQLVATTADGIGYFGYNGFGTNYQNGASSLSTNEKDKSKSTSGDTFIFNSPKAIDEIEAAKQLKATKRDMAEGF